MAWRVDGSVLRSNLLVSVVDEDALALSLPVLMLRFLGKAGDLAQLGQGKAGGVHPRENLTHELADCLWSVRCLADG